MLAAVATSLSGGDGISYLVRMAGVLLIASYAYASTDDGDLFDLGVWIGSRLGARRTGFALGLTAELVLGSLAAAADDLAQIRLAVEQKRFPLLRTWFSTGSALLNTELRRGRDLAGLLALRGYSGGGVHVPKFAPLPADMATAALAVVVLFLAIFAPRDIFILIP
jgi:hypothetical protein